MLHFLSVKLVTANSLSKAHTALITFPSFHPCSLLFWLVLYSANAVFKVGNNAFDWPSETNQAVWRISGVTLFPIWQLQFNTVKFFPFWDFFQVSHPSNILVISHTSHIANEICIGKLWWGGVWEVCFPLTLIDQRRGLVCWDEGCPSQPKSDFRSFLASSWRFAGRCHATPPSHKPASK